MGEVVMTWVDLNVHVHLFIYRIGSYIESMVYLPTFQTLVDSIGESILMFMYINIYIYINNDINMIYINIL